VKNLLISGLPRCGKTTLVKQISDAQSLSDRIKGFITEEIREKGERVGFKIISLPEREEGFLARKGFSSPYWVGAYGVNIAHLEKIGVASIERGLTSGKIILLMKSAKWNFFLKSLRKFW